MSDFMMLNSEQILKSGIYMYVCKDIKLKIINA